MTHDEGINRAADALLNEFVICGAVDFKGWSRWKLCDFEPAFRAKGLTAEESQMAVHALWGAMTARLIPYVPAESRELVTGYLSAVDDMGYLGLAFEQRGGGSSQDEYFFLGTVQQVVDDAVANAVAYQGRGSLN